MLVEKDMSTELKQMIRHSSELTFGAAGIFEGDDGENMEGCTAGGDGYVEIFDGSINIVCARLQPAAHFIDARFFQSGKS